jgi:hypothetical protein
MWLTESNYTTRIAADKPSNSGQHHRLVPPVQVSRMLEELRNAVGFFSVPDLSGRVALVTGANSGVGYELTKELVTHGAEVGGQQHMVIYSNTATNSSHCSNQVMTCGMIPS